MIFLLPFLSTSSLPFIFALRDKLFESKVLRRDRFIFIYDKNYKKHN